MKQSDRFWHVAVFSLATLAMGAMAGAIFVLHWSYGIAEQAIDDEAKKHYLAGLSVITGVLIIFAAFCLGLVMIRYFVHRMKMLQGQSEPTEYVDAWKIAGQRFTLPEELDNSQWKDEDEQDDEDDTR